MAFTSEDGELFRRLSRELELTKLMGYINDEQIPLVVLMGASGAGKTSLLRAGLLPRLREKAIPAHYWEAVPNRPEEALLHAIRLSWDHRTNVRSDEPTSLDDLAVPPATSLAHRVIILDQFEQLSVRNFSRCPVFRALRKMIRESKPPHRTTWIIAFRREFRPDWSDFIIPEQDRGFHPLELSLRLFSREQANATVAALVDQAHLAVEQKVIDNMLDAATVNGEISPVDIGIGMLVLAELIERRAGDTFTTVDFQFAGGSEGLLTEYVRTKLDVFSDEDREHLFKAMLALSDLKKNQRVAEGRTAGELAREADCGTERLQTGLRFLASGSVRLLEIEGDDGEREPRYRLPHDRIIPAIRRLTGVVLAEADQARLKFESACLVWENSRRSPQYLLRGPDLRLVLRFQNQISLDRESNREFLSLSRRNRNRRRIGYGVFAAFLGVSCLVGYFYARLQGKREIATTQLRAIQYPPELYDWQRQLTNLELGAPVDPHQLSWLESRRLEHLSLMFDGPSGSAMENVSQLASLKSLSLDHRGIHFPDLAPLEKLMELNQLTLDLRDPQYEGFASLAALTRFDRLSANRSGPRVSELASLEKLTQLNRLTLRLASPRVSELSPLAELTQLNQLTLNLWGSEVSDLRPLEKLRGLKQLTLRLDGSEVRDLTPLEKLTGLNELSLDLGNSIDELARLDKLMRLDQRMPERAQPGGSEVRDLTALEKLTGLSHLSLNLGPQCEGRVLAPLASLTGLNQLTLDTKHSRVRDLTPLGKLTRLNQLTLRLGGDNDEPDLAPLETVAELNQLTLDLGSSKFRDLRSLEKLTGLAQLTLEMGHSAVSDLTLLEKLTHLKQLTLCLGDSKVRDFGPLANLTGLNTLSLEMNHSEARDLGPLEKLTELHQLTLEIRYSAVSDLRPLEKLRGLNQLTLRIDGSQVGDLTPLEKLTGLNELSLDLGDWTGELSSLEKLTQLNQLTLDLERSGVSDLRPLEKLRGLNQLTLRIGDSKIRDLTALEKLTGLNTLSLDIWRSQIGDLGPVEKLPNLKHLRIVTNLPQGLSLHLIPKALTDLNLSMY
jgi:hypothetical protein